VSPQPIQPVRAVHPIEARSYQILRRRADTSALPPLTRCAVVTDAHMVAAGITSVKAICRVRDVVAAKGLTRSAAGIRRAHAEVGPGAVWVIGNAPTALEELLTLDADPALVVGLPVGFVGAAESKAALRASGLPAVSNVSEKGGSAVAAAAVNALLYATPQVLRAARGRAASRDRA